MTLVNCNNLNIKLYVNNGKDLETEYLIVINNGKLINYRIKFYT